MSSVPVIKFLFRSDWKALSDALVLKPIYESESFDSVNDLATFLSGIYAGLVVVSLKEKEDIVQLARLMKLLKKIATNTIVKVIVVNFSGDKRFEKAVAKLGLLDLLEDKIQTKALRFKIDFVMKSISAQVKNSTGAQNTKAVKTLESGKNQEKQATEGTRVWTNPLDTENDIWLLRNETDCKKILTRWLVKLLGPSPYVASWVDSGTPGVWKFEFKSSDNAFIVGDGTWLFKGDQKPDFIWSENIWSFTGNSFELFYKEGNNILSRVKLKDKQLSISKTSEFAKFKEKSIVESFDKDLLFKKELQGSGKKEAFDKENNQYRNLEGKGKTDALNQSPLSSTSKPEDRLTDQDKKSQKNTNSQSSSFWKGKHEPQKEDKNGLEAAVDAQIKPGSELSLENNNTHQKYYKNHNKSEQFEPKEIGHALEKNGVSEKLKGKTESGNFTTADDASDLNGKSSTDQLERNLTSPNLQKEKIKKEQSDKGNLNGQTATDSISGYLSSLEAKKNKNIDHSNTPEKEQSGKSSTEKSAGHLSSPDAKKNYSSDTALGTSEKESKEKSKAEKSTGYLSSPSANKDKATNPENNKTEKEHNERSLTEKMAGYLSSPEAKKNRTAESDKSDSGKKLKEKTLPEKMAEHSSLHGRKNENVESQEKNTSEKAPVDKSLTEKMAGHLSSPILKRNNEKAPEKESREIRPSIEKLTKHLAALRAKKEKIEKERLAQATSERNKSQKILKSREQKKVKILGSNVSERKEMDNSEKPDELLAEASSPQALMDHQQGKILAFTGKEKEKAILPGTTGSKELDDAMETATVTSLLIQGSRAVQCQLDDYFDQTIIFHTQESGIAQSEMVKLNLNFNYMNKDMNLKFDGNVIVVEADAEGAHFITVKISDENASSFNAFIKLYKTRQDNIDVFLKAVKGY